MRPFKSHSSEMMQDYGAVQVPPLTKDQLHNTVRCMQIYHINHGIMLWWRT